MVELVITSDDILNDIIKQGYFLYHPQRWSKKTDKILQELEEISLIERESVKKGTQDNNEYTYVAK